MHGHDANCVRSSCDIPVGTVSFIVPYLKKSKKRALGIPNRKLDLLFRKGSLFCLSEI